MLTKLAVKWLTRQIRKDPDLYYAYQSNIAMQIQDLFANVNKYKKIEDLDIHFLSNKAAKNFLDIWIK